MESQQTQPTDDRRIRAIRLSSPHTDEELGFARPSRARRAASPYCQSHTTPTVMRGVPDCRSRKNTDAACCFPQPSQLTSMIFPCSALGSIVVWCRRLQSGHVQLMSCGRRTATLDFGRDQAAMRSLYRVRRLLNSLHPRLARNPRSEDRRSLPKSRAARDRSRRLGARELQRRPSATRTR